MLKEVEFQLVISLLVRETCSKNVVSCVSNDIIMLIFKFCKIEYISKLSSNFCFQMEYSCDIQLDYKNPNKLTVLTAQGTVFRPISFQDPLKPGSCPLLCVTYCFLFSSN